MNKAELAKLVSEILGEMQENVPAQRTSCSPTEEAPDITTLDLRKLYLVKNPKNPEAFRKIKERTPARLGSGHAGPRYKTLTALRFRADHAAAQDAVFSQVSEDFAQKHGMVPVQTLCKDKEEYLTGPDKGRLFDRENQEKIRKAETNRSKIQLVVGDGLSSAAIEANAVPCLEAIQEGLKARGLEAGKPIFVRYCRVGAGDAVGDVTGCDVVCVLVGERPGLATDKSMSAYITYQPRRGVSESARTVVSNIHEWGTPAKEAGKQIAELISAILDKKVSGVGFHRG